VLIRFFRNFMLVLLDENLPHRLRLLIPGHDVRTVDYQGWKSLSNGELLQAAEDAGFSVMVTADKGMHCQQNLSGKKIALVVLSTPKREIVVARAALIVAAVNAATPGSFAVVDIGQ
jgi:predicted nuclease of predicted toxin-antitoxin system